MTELLTKSIPPSGPPPFKTATGFEGDFIEDLGERIISLSRSQKKELSEAVKQKIT